MASRDQAESAGHSLTLALDTFRSTGIPLTYITLKPLEPDSVEQLTAAALGATADVAAVAALRHDARQNVQRDGMDVALCRLEPDGVVTFAGAGCPLYVIEHGLLREIRGDRGGVGSSKRQRLFTEHRLHLPPGAMLYLGSDGFADQNNPQGQRYGSPALKQTLQEVASQAPPLQQHLEWCFDTHRSGEPQRDDVTLVGIRISYQTGQTA